MSPRRSLTPSLALAAVAALALTVTAGPSASAAPGDTLTLSAPSGVATPGKALTYTATLTSSTGTVQAGKDVTLSVDHGFFTDGKESVPSVVGAPAGNLHQLGSSLTATTDSKGQVTFEVGIQRDAGFDDDGKVTSVVTATADGATGQGNAAWSSANPLNGSVEVALSPTSRQEQPVAPAVSGDRVWYDVFTRDQFGNPVDGQSVDLDFSGQRTDFDYSEDSVTSDLAREGDFWVTSFVPGDLVVTGLWTTPSYTYSSTTGSASAHAPADVSGATAASFYDVDFNASSFSLVPAIPGDVAVGSTVTETATVVDQRGNPVRGYEVKFFRFGPDSGGGSDQRADRITNNRGQASYSFVGADPATAKVTAVVSDGVHERTLTSEVRFRYPVSVSLAAATAKAAKTEGADGADVDAMTVHASKVAAGAKVAVYRAKGSKLKHVKAEGVKLDDAGNVTFAVPDTNGRRKTKYVVVVAATSTTFAATSDRLKLR